MIFGNHLHQQGSKIYENKLHFDFNFEGSVSLDDLFNIEKIVNDMITKNISCKTSLTSLEEAVKTGATALFGEKYGKTVRVVDFENFSKELCGGTHVKRTGDIGIFVIHSCSGIGKGLKRITALLAEDALSFIQNRSRILEQSFKIVGATADTLLDRIEKMVKEKSNKKPVSAKEYSLEFIKDSPIPFAVSICDEDFSASEVLKKANKISGMVLFISGGEKKRITLASGGKNGPKADEILSAALGKLGGKGGGNARTASGGVFDIDAKEIVKEILNEINRFLRSSE
jgi:alanyl-tRNA synthetase